jgi:Fucose-binding lectin II (PA-IIL)
MKNSIALFTFMCILNMAAAQDTVKIYVNSKLAGTAITKGSDEIPVVKIKKIKSSLLKNITVQLGRNNAQNSLYKKSITASDEETTLLVAEENKKQPGSFYLPVNIIGKKLAAGKKVKLVLQLNPPDDRMMMPSRMMELCYIVM